MNRTAPLPRREFFKSIALVSVCSEALGFPWSGRILAAVSPQAASTLGQLRLNLTSFPPLQKELGSVRLKVPGMPANFAEILITRVENNQFHSVTSRCTHQSCTVNTLTASSKLLACPCHGSRFNPDGSVANGPATRPLTAYNTTFDQKETISIEIPGLGYSMTAAAVQPVAGKPARLQLSFPTTTGAKFEVRFSPSMGSVIDWRLVSFALTAEGAADQTSLAGTGQPATVFVDRAEEAGFFLIVRG